MKGESIFIESIFSLAYSGLMSPLVQLQGAIIRHGFCGGDTLMPMYKYRFVYEILWYSSCF